MRYFYALSFSFEQDGDFESCYSYEDTNVSGSAYTDCYPGTWEWIEVGESIRLTENISNTQTEITDIDIIELSASKLVGSITEDEDGYDYEIEFTAIKQ